MIVANNDTLLILPVVPVMMKGPYIKRLLYEDMLVKVDQGKLKLNTNQSVVVSLVAVVHDH